MKYLLSKDRKKRSNFEKLEKNRLMFRFFSRNRILFSSSFSKLFLAESKKKKKNDIWEEISENFLFVKD
jgi:hypothetical protein